MAKSNRNQIGDALMTFVEGMVPFVCREMQTRHKDDWEEKVREIMRNNRSTASKADNDSIPWDTALVIQVILREWQCVRVTGQDRLPVRASKKLIAEELYVTEYSGIRLKMDLDRIPLWRGDHVGIKQLCEDVAQYVYLPRCRDSEVLIRAIENGLSTLTWREETFAYAEGYDSERNRYLGLRAGDVSSIVRDGSSVLVKPDVADRQMESDRAAADRDGSLGAGTGAGTGRLADPQPSEDYVGRGGAEGGSPAGVSDSTTTSDEPATPKRFYGVVELNPNRLGRDAGRIADEVLGHLMGQAGAKAEVTLEIQVQIEDGVPDHVVRTVMENCRTLKFTTQDFESE